LQRQLDLVLERNLRVWSSIKKPSPEAFFENLPPLAADGHIRQALVLCWMMLPRGHRSLAIVRSVVQDIYQRMMNNWSDDSHIFTKGPGKRSKQKPPVKTVLKKPRKKSLKKSPKKSPRKR
jgi:hypothetical protein